MDFKDEFLNAVKLFLLLSMLLWSFTWNDSPDFNSDYQTKGLQKRITDTDKGNKLISNGPEDYSKATTAATYENEQKTTSISKNILPSFYEWRERELVKYEESSPEKMGFQNSKMTVRRKLNYASSKCGAKVLASNQEAKHRAAVLSEKPDEYMLNPCRAKTWFIVELCDTVEITQFELANHELYSSSPKKFSVFSSDIYPTSEWRLLGTFEAKDQRTMQTFDLNIKKLMKFIKVVIYNHYGKEHYCPLSIVRVLGYSMVQKFEDIDDTENNAIKAMDDSRTEKMNNIPFKTQPPFSNAIETLNGVQLSNKICLLVFEYCVCETKMTVDKTCLKQPIACRFLETMLKISANCYEALCPKLSKKRLKVSDSAKSHTNSTYQKTRLISDIMDPANDYPINESSSENKDILKDYEKGIPLKVAGNDSYYVTDKISVKQEILEEQNRIIFKNQTNNEYQNNEKISTDQNVDVEMPQRSSKIDNQAKCFCGEHEESKAEFSYDKRNLDLQSLQTSSSENSVESAGLINTESVIFKLTTRIKSLEMDLKLINEYLQQLSQSYRQQMLDMKGMFDQTIQAINIQLEKTKAVNENQEENISNLKEKTRDLNQKVRFLVDGQKNMLNKVVELHAFFFILELIVISTIFSIFLNFLHRRTLGIKTPNYI